jgi:23S rRNA (guanosine2251-2'-O)-methyltransferase
MIVYGKQVVFYILEKHPKLIKTIYLTKEIEPKLFKKFSKLDVKIVRPDHKKAQSLARGGNHQGFLLDIEPYSYAPISKIKKGNFIVVLDRLSDVGNIGAIIRSCYALGVDGLVICGIKNPVAQGIIRTSSGAMLDMDVALYNSSIDLANELQQKDFFLLGASMDGDELKSVQVDPSCKKALFLGSESEGLLNKLEQKLDQKVAIKMHNDFNSLNVSVAAAILIYELK